MDSLNHDVCIYKIFPLLLDKERLRFTSVNKYFRQLIEMIRFDERIEIFDGMVNKWYYNKLSNIDTNIIPLPNSVTHLTFGNSFYQDIQNAIPNSVTHLTFGYWFNQYIKNAIPNSVTHLTFGFAFNQNIKGNIPNSVTHLTFGYCF